MEFFEPPAPRPEQPPQPRHELPPWFEAPHGILPGVVALELLLARTSKVAVCATRLEAYPTGFGLELITMADQDDEEGFDPMFFGPHRRRLSRQRGDEIEIPNEMLRFGVEFADGTKATNTADEPLVNPAGGTIGTMVMVSDSEPEPAPVAPVLRTGGGGGGGGSWRQSIWIWPLPPPGRLTFVCQWPEAGIELTRHDIDAQIILEAATRAEVIFPA
jgi:hypothetical protein